MKRHSLVLMTTVAIVTAVAGCSSSSTPSDNTATTSGAANGSTASSSEGDTTSSEDGTSSSQAGESGHEFATGGTFVFGMSSAPDKLHPLESALVITATMSNFAYDALVRQNAAGDIVPNLATKWTVTGNEIVFDLRDDVTCSDKTPLTAETVANNINFVNNEANASPLRGTYYSADAKATFDEAAHTVTVSTPSPDQFLLVGLASQPIVCQDMLDHPDHYADKTLGTGPWVLSSSTPGQSYIYTKRADYHWGPGGSSMDEPGVPDKVELRVVTDPTTLSNLLLAGQVNYGRVDGPDAVRLSDAHLASNDLQATTGTLLFNEASGKVGNDPAVRQALITATDIPTVRKVATQNRGVASTGLVMAPPVPCMGDTVTGNLPDFDVEKAKQILDNAGWKEGPNGIRSKDGKQLDVTFIYPKTLGTAGVAGAELVAQEWGAVGANVTLKAWTSQELGNIIFTTGEWDAGWVAITVGQPGNLIPFYSGEAPPDGSNFTHIDNATYNADVAEASKLTGQEGCEKWAEAEKSLFTNFDIAPMFNILGQYFMKNATVEAPLGFSVFADTIRLYVP